MGITTWGFGSCCGTIGVGGWGEGLCNVIPDILAVSWATAPSLDYCVGTRDRGTVLLRVKPDSISSRPRCAT